VPRRTVSPGTNPPHELTAANAELREMPRQGTPLPALGEGPGVRAAADPPRKNGELVFEEPWQGRAFGMAVALNEGACYAWDDFRERLIARIAAADLAGDPSGYYERWLAAFEQLLTETGVISREELDERTAEIEFGERDDIF
jgi:nitrile hydratase accessory protein